MHKITERRRGLFYKISTISIRVRLGVLTNLKLVIAQLAFITTLTRLVGKPPGSKLYPDFQTNLRRWGHLCPDFGTYISPKIGDLCPDQEQSSACGGRFVSGFKTYLLVGFRGSLVYPPSLWRVFVSEFKLRSTVLITVDLSLLSPAGIKPCFVNSDFEPSRAGTITIKQSGRANLSDAISVYKTLVEYMSDESGMERPSGPSNHSFRIIATVNLVIPCKK